jgi:hypothetical protein
MDIIYCAEIKNKAPKKACVRQHVASDKKRHYDTAPKSKKQAHLKSFFRRKLEETLLGPVSKNTSKHKTS